MNSYSTLQDEETAVEQFLNREVQEAMCCLDTGEPSDDPSTTPNELTAENISNPHDQTMDQDPTHIRQSIQPLSVKFLQILPVMLPNLYRLSMAFW